MKGLKLIIGLAAVVLAAGIIVWRAGLLTPKPQAAEKEVERTVETEPNKPSEPAGPSDANEAEKPAEPNEPDKSKKPVESEKPAESEKPGEPNDPNKPGEPNGPMENMNFTDMEMKNIVQKLADWTGKDIIPLEEAMKQKLTIYTAKKVPRTRALALIYRALREKGIVVEQENNTLVLKPLKDAKRRSVPTVPADYPLAKLQNKDEIVEKFFKLSNCSPTQLEKVVKNFLPEYGYVYAVESTGHLVVIDTVGNLQRIARVIEQLDIPETQETVIKTFSIKQGDPVEIVQLLNLLLGDGGGRGGGRSKGGDKNRGRESGKDEKKEGGAAASVIIASSESPMTLIPLPKFKWIIAKASAEDMIQIEKWIDNFDQRKPEEREHTLRQIEHADVRELSEQINAMLQQMPLRANVMVQPLVRAKQLMIIGSEENRKMVETLIDEIDIPIEQYLTERIPLKYADPEVVKQNIEELFEDVIRYSYSDDWGRGTYSRRRRPSPGDTHFLRVIANPILKEVTVITSAANMEKIKEMILQWDKPIDVDEVAPLIIELKNSDPVKMVDLLSNLFTETQRRFTWRDYYYGRGGATRTIVGPLYGQMSFEAVPDTRKIVVQSKIPEGYDVVKKLVAELDRQEMAEVPRVVTLDYADAEDLSERLNAIFCEPGTVAPIRLRKGRLSKTGMETTEGETTNGNGSGSGTTDVYTPPWSRGGRRREMEMPISNVIGRIRFIPDPRSNTIMVLAPPEFIDSVAQMIKDLDNPVDQLRIKAIVLEVNHADMTSLGLRLSSNPEAFAGLGEDAVSALTQLAFLEERGSLTTSVEMNVVAVLDFLVKKLNARVLSEQTLWTKDNEEADLFKGETVPFISTLTVSAEGGREGQDVSFEEVGMTLRILPNITPQRNVDMNLDLTISQLTSEVINNQPVRTYVNTTTTAIARDGQTIMIGGILFKESSVLEKKIALLGDLPLLGGLFRHKETREGNNEMIIFITPEVVGEEDMLAETAKANDKLDSMLKDLNSSLEEIE